MLDAGDYLVIDTAWGRQTGLSPGMLSDREARFGQEYVSQLIAAVPEPGAAALLAAPVFLSGRRMRPRSSTCAVRVPAARTSGVLRRK